MVDGINSVVKRFTQLCTNKEWDEHLRWGLLKNTTLVSYYDQSTLKWGHLVYRDGIVLCLVWGNGGSEQHLRVAVCLPGDLSHCTLASCCESSSPKSLLNVVSWNVGFVLLSPLSLLIRRVLPFSHSICDSSTYPTLSQSLLENPDPKSAAQIPTFAG
mmetsp:Transcript_1720/g.6032  ORF Transcript_1720/g.6032 Transcript_1720/m.6032 type:complete len:158 (-) Transcript_1720:556-1029(-)